MTIAGLSAPESCISFLVLMQAVNVWHWRHWYVVVVVVVEIITSHHHHHHSHRDHWRLW